MPVDHVTKALNECLGAVQDGGGSFHTDEDALKTFVEKFRKDFNTELSSNPAKWQNDRRRVTTLAQAIGATAAFLAVAEDEDDETPGIEYRHLKLAFKVLKPLCKPDNKKPRPTREYCTEATP